MMETRDTEDLAVLDICQREKTLVLRPVHRNPAPRVRTRIGLAEEKNAGTGYRYRKSEMHRVC